VVHALLSNNIKVINKNLTNYTKSGFIDKAKAKDILMQTVNKLDTSLNTEKIVENILSKN
jgi:hypothetical protein